MDRSSQCFAARSANGRRLTACSSGVRARASSSRRRSSSAATRSTSSCRASTERLPKRKSARQCDRPVKPKRGRGARNRPMISNYDNSTALWFLDCRVLWILICSRRMEITGDRVLAAFAASPRRVMESIFGKWMCVRDWSRSGGGEAQRRPSALKANAPRFFTTERRIP